MTDEQQLMAAFQEASHAYGIAQRKANAFLAEIGKTDPHLVPEELKREWYKLVNEAKQGLDDLQAAQSKLVRQG